MKYKILKGTELFDKLSEFQNRRKVVRGLADDLAVSFGGIAAATNGRNLSGGIDAVDFDDIIPDKNEWRKVGNRWQSFYYPKAKNKAALNLISQLPVIKFDELNDIVGFKGGQTVSDVNGIAWVKSVGLHAHKDFILLETAEGTKYTPHKDAIEILGSEFDKLLKKIK
jgi:hypothetical protein